MSRFMLLLVAFLAVRCVAFAAEWHVFPDGSGDAPTIQAAIDSSLAGDEVLVHAGTYFEHDVRPKSDLWIRSIGGTSATILDANFEGAGFIDTVVTNVRVSGFTIIHGRYTVSAGQWGGAILISQSGTHVFEDCIITQNESARHAAIYCDSNGIESVSALFRNCLIVDNHCTGEPGEDVIGISNYITATLENCTIADNSVEDGAAIRVSSASSLIIRNTIVAFTQNGYGIRIAGSGQAWLECCNVFGNSSGEFHGFPEDPTGQNGNISEDPQFCDSPPDGYLLMADSPCAPGNHPDGQNCGLIGIFDVGCDGTSGLPGLVVRNVTWGQVKGMFR